MNKCIPLEIDVKEVSMEHQCVQNDICDMEEACVTESQTFGLWNVEHQTP